MQIKDDICFLKLQFYAYIFENMNKLISLKDAKVDIKLTPLILGILLSIKVEKFSSRLPI